MEYSKQENYKTTTSKLEERMLFGSYPELEQYPDWRDKINYIKEIIQEDLLEILDLKLSVILIEIK